MLDEEMTRWLDALPADSPLIGLVDQAGGTLRMPMTASAHGHSTSWTRTKIQVGLLITRQATKAKIK